MATFKLNEMKSMTRKQLIELNRSSNLNIDCDMYETIDSLANALYNQAKNLHLIPANNEEPKLAQVIIYSRELDRKELKQYIIQEKLDIDADDYGDIDELYDAIDREANIKDAEDVISEINNMFDNLDTNSDDNKQLILKTYNKLSEILGESTIRESQINWS